MARIDGRKESQSKEEGPTYPLLCRVTDQTLIIISDVLDTIHNITT
jgi:hypothetical protein